MCSTTHVTTDSLLQASVTFLTVKSNNFPHNNDCDVRSIEMCNTKKITEKKVWGKGKGKGKVHPCRGTVALYRPYGPWGGVEV